MFGNAADHRPLLRTHPQGQLQQLVGLGHSGGGHHLSYAEIHFGEVVQVDRTLVCVGLRFVIAGYRLPIATAVDGFIRGWFLF